MLRGISVQHGGFEGRVRYVLLLILWVVIVFRDFVLLLLTVLADPARNEEDAEGCERAAYGCTNYYANF